MINKIKISAIVPVYNESPYLDEVISNLVKIKCIDEFICINDGSTDNSLEILNKFNNKITIVTYEKNKGKGFAVAQGLKVTNGEIVVLLDADITDYSKEHILDLCNPLVNNKLRFTIGLFPSYKEIIKIKSISGLRAYYKNDIFHLVKELEKSTKYGIDPILNMKLKHLKHDYIKIPRVNHISKYQKHKPRKAIREYSEEGKSLAEESFRILRETEL